MSAFYLTMVAVILAGLGSRDHVTVATITQRQGQRPGVLVIAIVLSVATAAFAAWAASVILPLMQPPARMVLGALALAFAGGESLIIAPRPVKGQPTQSLGALSIVLLAHQATDAARFVIFGIAVAASAPIPAGGGGALGGIVLLGFAWALPEHSTHPRLRIARRLIGIVFLFVAAYIAMRALNRI